MTDRAVLAIEINDDAFKAFQAKFAAYQKAVGDMPAQWDAVNKSTGASRPVFEKLIELIEHQNELVNKVADGTERSEKPTQNVAASWGVIYRTGRLWSSNIKSSTLSLAKWSGLTAVFSGILASGGLYGIDRMAASVSGRRTVALGYGTTIGAQSSFVTNFGRIGNAEGILSSTSRALSDPRSRVFRSLGVSGKIEGMDAPHAFAAILPDIERLLKRTPENQLNSIIQGYGLGEIGLGLNEARFIRNAPTGETAKMIKGFASDEGAMGVANPEAWSRFSTQMELAGGAIRVAFERNLASMTLPLGRITSSFETLFTALLKKGGMADDLIKIVGGGVDKFAKMIGSKSIVSAVDEFISRFDMTTKQFDVFNDWLGNHLPEVKIILAAAAGYMIGGPWGAAIGAGVAVGSMWNGPDTPYGRSGITPHSRGGGSTPYAPDRADDRRSSTPYQHRPSLGGIPAPWTTPETGGTSPSVHGSLTTGMSASAADSLMQLKGMRDHDPKERALIAEYLRSGGHGMDPASVSWCAAAVGSALRKAGYQDVPAGAGGNVANAYQKWGRGVDWKHGEEIHKDDVLVTTRGLHPGQIGGHVSLLTGRRDGQGRYEVIEGDTRNYVHGRRAGHKADTDWERLTPSMMVRRGVHNHPNNSMKQSATPVDVVNNTNGASQVSVAH
jgi:hypothetical protein